MLDLKSKRLPDLSPDKIRTEYSGYLANASTHRYQMAEDYDFYLGNQLTVAQKEFLIGMGQPPESNNKIRPAVEQVLANVAASSPDWAVKMVGATDYDLAYVISQLMAQIWYESDGDMHYRDNCIDFITKGLTYAYVYPDWNAEGGLGALRLMILPPEAVFVDPNSINRLFKDASSLIYSDLHVKEQLKTALPQYAEKIESAREDAYQNELATGLYSRDNVYSRSRTGYLDSTQPKVRKFVRFAKVSVPVARIIDPVTGYTAKYTDEEYDELTKVPEYHQLVADGDLIEQVAYETNVRETFVIGDIEIYDEILPISEYPIVPACNNHTRNPFPSGDVRHAKSPQRMLNRTEASIIAYTDAVSNYKVGFEENAIEPEELAKFSTPGTALIKFNPGAIKDKKVLEFGVHQAPSELFHQKRRYEKDIEQIFGAWEFQQGNPAGAPGTVGEAQIIDEAAARKQNWKMLPLYDMLTGIGKIAVEWLPLVYDQQRVLRLVNPQGEMEEITLNLPVADDRTQAVRTMYDMTSLKADIKVVVGSTRAKSPLAKLQKDLSLLSADVYDRVQVIMGLEDSIDKKSLLQRKGEITQLEGTVQQLQDRVKQLEGDLDTRERELFHSNMRAEISEATKTVSKAAAEIKASAKLQEARMKDMVTNASNDLKGLLAKVSPSPAAVG